MKLYRSLEELPLEQPARALAVGTFDGVHLGHRRVIASALEWGSAHDLTVTVMTFDPHPLRVLAPDDAPLLLTPASVKADLIAELGVDELLIMPFTEDFARVAAADFCRDILAGELQARHVSVGQNFRFGHRAEGDAQMLRRCLEFETEIVPLVVQDGSPVSSSRIRRLLIQGALSRANELLGSSFQLDGLVVEGDRRGRSLGMPTANLEPEPNTLLPGAGIYAGAGKGHPAAVSIGVRPTFDTGGELLVEAFLLDFDGDLYGQRLRLRFFERLRDEVSFDSTDELVEQMRRDVERVRGICNGFSLC